MIDVQFASAEQCAQKKSREEEYDPKFEYVMSITLMSPLHLRFMRRANWPTELSARLCEQLGRLEVRC
jgi:hypothetical protein